MTVKNIFKQLKSTHCYHIKWHVVYYIIFYKRKSPQPVFVFSLKKYIFIFFVIFFSKFVIIGVQNHDRQTIFFLKQVSENFQLKLSAVV